MGVIGPLMGTARTGLGRRLWRFSGGSRMPKTMLADLALLAAMVGSVRAVSLAAGTLPAARIVMLRGVTEVHHG